MTGESGAMANIFELIDSANVESLEQELKGGNLLKQVNIPRPTGDPPIVAAVKSRSVRMVQLLLEAGANVNQESEEEGSFQGYTAAHYAAGSGEVDMLKLLHNHKADLNRRSADQWTPLHCATYRGKLQAAKFLIDAGVEVDCYTQFGHTPLLFAVNHGRVRDVRFLLKCGALPKLVDSNGDSLLHHCFHYQMSKLFEGGYDVPEVQLDVAVVLVLNGIPVTEKNAEGNAATHFIQEDMPTLQPLLEMLYANRSKFMASTTEWNYMTLVSAGIEHYIGMGIEAQEAVNLHQAMEKLESERVASKKRREEERPQGGCPVIRGKRSKPAAGGAPPAVAPGEDPSGGKCPFFKKNAAATATDGAAPELPAGHPAPVESVTVGADPSNGKCPHFQKAAKEANSTLQSLAQAPSTQGLAAQCNLTTVLLMVISFLLGIYFEQAVARFSVRPQ